MYHTIVKQIEALILPVVSKSFCGKCGKPSNTSDWCKKCYDDYYKED